MEIQVLHRQGKGIRAIARETGVARNTIRAILTGKSDAQYGPRRPHPTKVDAQKVYLQERIEAAGKIQLPATVLLREIRAKGYEGGITQLKEYLREIRPAPPMSRWCASRLSPVGNCNSILWFFGEAPSRCAHLLPSWDSRDIRTSSSRATRAA